MRQLKSVSTSNPKHTIERLRTRTERPDSIIAVQNFLRAGGNCGGPVPGRAKAAAEAAAAAAAPSALAALASSTLTPTSP